MNEKEKIDEWLKRARSSLARAKAGKISKEILYEDLCYDAQQAVKKSLKALCIKNGIVFPKTHNIEYLLELLENNSKENYDEIKEAKILTYYAIETRYPGDYEPVEDQEYLKAIDIAARVLKWVEFKIKDNKN